MRHILLSIVVPCYNEEKNIPLILKRFQEVLTRDDVEIILVNNGSTDASADVLAALLPQYPFASSVHVPVNQGYGYGILSGLKNARGEFLGWTHADMQTDPFDVIKALSFIEDLGKKPNLYIKGSRKGRGYFDSVFTIGMSIFESIYLMSGLWEINAQPNIFHRSFFASWQNPPHDFSLDLYAYYNAKKSHLKIIRFPVKYPERIHGTSSWNTSFKQKLKFIRRTLEYSYKLKHALKIQGTNAHD